MNPVRTSWRASSRVLLFHGAILAALIVFQSAYLLWWLRSDTRPPAWDESHHLLNAWSYRQSLSEGDWDGLVRPLFSNYPPLYHLSLASRLEAGDDVDAVVERAVLVNIPYLILLILSVYFLGTLLASSEAGLCAAALASFAPILLWLSHRPMIDMPLAAWVSFAFLCLVRSDEFARPGWALALGAACGAGMMTKWTFVIYAGVPVAWGLLAGLRGRRWRSIALFLLGGAAAAGPWYACNGVSAFFKTQKLASLQETRDPARWSWESLGWYVNAVSREGILWPLLSAAGLGLIAALFQRRWLLVAWALVPWAVFSAIQNKDLRYYAPALPALALMTALLPESFSSVRFGRFWRIGWAALAVFLGLAYGTADRWPSFARTAAAWAGLQPFSTVRRAPGLASEVLHDSPRAEDWKTDEILKRIEERSAPERPVRVALIANHPYFQTWAFRFASKVQGRENLVFFNPKARLGEFSDYILWKTGDMGPEFTLGYLSEAARLLREPPVWLEKTFARAAEWELPDGSRAVLFARDVKDAAWPSALGETVFSLERFPLPRFEARGLRVHFVPSSADRARKGEFSRIVIECERLDYRGLVLDDVRLEGRDVQINLPRLIENKELIFLRVGEFRPSVQIEAGTLTRYLEAKARWLSDPQVRLEDGFVFVRGRVRGWPVAVSAGAALSPSRDAVTLSLREVRVGPVTVPLFLIRGYARKTFSLEPSKDLQFPVRVDELTIEKGQLTVRSSS